MSYIISYNKFCWVNNINSQFICKFIDERHVKKLSEASTMLGVDQV